jgi:hypothetical protein
MQNYYEDMKNHGFFSVRYRLCENFSNRDTAQQKLESVKASNILNFN